MEKIEKKHEKKETVRSSIVLKVYRANRRAGESVHYNSIEVPVQRWTTVLDALLYAKAYKDKSIGIRYSCRMASCGSCGMKINGIPRLACYTKVSELEGSTITVEPLANFPHIRDLVTDFSQFFSHHRDVRPYIQNDEADIKDRAKLSEFMQSPEDLDKFLQFSYCIKCGLCYSACPTVATDTKFPGPQALSQAYRYFIDNRDAAGKERENIVDDRHGIWRCHFAGSCSSVCPKGVDPALGIQLLRGHLLGFSKNEKKVADLRERSKRD
ncbi:MAG: succinate dehydrogenase iron-sulfur subunit [Thaumarchaeota archaeon 13_1_40CM_3_50_5]|nr:MAG: succinate dehydrogenase iron-sulfur subunit [Thaumarchaeota archaeon 13_1_40CM_3_50_5]